jgi:hypothetical protein
MQRRRAIAALVGGVGVTALGRMAHVWQISPVPPDFQAIERQVGGRLGIAVLETASKRRTIAERLSTS